ncbi:MAG: voltage-gated potassium channel [Planctomycetaceae bacterium]|nr:voltage-gated potassium channel [Planctomycetaceae bacterium]
MKSKLRYLESFILMLILYGIITHLLELEFDDSDNAAVFFLWSERIVTLLFTIEYFVRWISSRSWIYPFRLMAIIDLLAILPFYLGFLFDLRSLRLIRAGRVLRLMKLYRYTDALNGIQNAFMQVRYEFGIIGFAVFTLGCLCSVGIYESEKNVQPQMFAKLSDAAWYTVTTLTTVGYGDKVPVTLPGRLIAVVMMVCGLGLFGTFVSLIGSAFLEELRKAPRPTWRKAPPVAMIDAHHGVESHVSFDPADVLHDLDKGVYNKHGEQNQQEVTRLLTIACRLLTEQGQKAA